MRSLYYDWPGSIDNLTIEFFDELRKLLEGQDRIDLDLAIKDIVETIEFGDKELLTEVDHLEEENSKLDDEVTSLTDDVSNLEYSVEQLCMFLKSLKDNPENISQIDKIIAQHE
jgi:uncharacterized protein (DUF3084 family)